VVTQGTGFFARIEKEAGPSPIRASRVWPQDDNKRQRLEMTKGKGLQQRKAKAPAA
jgi:hypothetical protein